MWLLGDWTWQSGGSHRPEAVCLLCQVLAPWTAASVPLAGKGARTTWPQEEQCDEVELRAWHSHGQRKRAQLTVATTVSFTLTSLNIFGPNCLLLWDNL